MKGGSGQYTSGSSYGVYVNGPVGAQYDRVFGPQYASVPGNVIIGAQGQNLPPASQIPTSQQLALIQKAGGNKGSDIYSEQFIKLTEAINDLAEALNQPVFPFTHIKKATEKGGSRRTRRYRKH
jgi:hypothetical protein